MSGGFDALVPRPIDEPAVLDLTGPLTPEQLLALDDAKIVAAPARRSDRPAWRAALERWRADARQRHGYRGEIYDEPAAGWAARCFTCAQVWLWDELFYDHEAGRFTPERFLDDARERFGGLDAVVLWHAYPVIGIDDRNQWDFYRDVPGLADLVARLQAAGVAVFVDYNPWDTGTRRAGPDRDELAALVRETGVDGVFLDTLRKADPDLVEALQSARPGIVLEGESRLATERIADHASSWAQWFGDSEVPGVLRAHWFERRHMQHHVRRWHRDHSGELQSAWLNGVGVMVWEVVFGAWVGWSARDAATLRRMLPVQRAFSDVLTGGGWTPLVDLGDAAEDAGVHGSTFASDDLTLVLLVNRGDQDWTGALDPDGAGGWRPLHPPTTSADLVTVPGRGVAALVRTTSAAAQERAELVREALRPATHDDDARFPHRRSSRVPAPAVRSPGAPPADAVVVGAGEHVMTVRYRVRETGMYDGAPYVDEWKPLPPRLHDLRTLERVVVLPRPVRVQAREVTVTELAAFRGSDERGDGPATGVGLAEARAYAAAAGARLPTEDEWQLAATRPGFRRLSPAVWSWTESEHSDGRTRFVMLKGGADHRSEGSQWYVDGGVQPPEHALKYLLPGLGQDASPSIGFRLCWEDV